MPASWQAGQGCFPGTPLASFSVVPEEQLLHVVRHLMEAVDQVRRNEIHEKGKEHKELMKDSRYIWLKIRET